MMYTHREVRSFGKRGLRRVCASGEGPLGIGGSIICAVRGMASGCLEFLPGLPNTILTHRDIINCAAARNRKDN